MPQKESSDPEKRPGWEVNPPKNWGEEQARRIAVEIRRLRQGRGSAQWLSKRTEELGYKVSRSVISDLEIARRRYVTTAEIIVLARALDTAPIALMYPEPYWDSKVQLWPTPEGGESLEVEKILAVQWFTGEQGIYLNNLGMPLIDQQNFHSRLLALARAQKAFELQDRKRNLEIRLALRLRAKKDGLDYTDEEIDDLQSRVEDLQGRIDELRALGGRDLDAELQDEMFGNGG